MLFNSLDFAIFLPIVFFLYWFATKGKLKIQNILLLVASYFFYACWDWRFLFLLIFSTGLDYFTGIKIYEATSQRKKLTWLWLSIGINLSFLGVFKYYNFFAKSLNESLAALGIEASLSALQILLPVGISFYTFHGLSYVIDLFKNRIQPERNYIDYSLFVSYFPLLVAGPIERATHLLPQLKKNRQFDPSKSVDGLRQILWGLFKKIVIADNCAVFANEIFNNSTQYTGSTLFLGAVFFTFQIYCDFSGYSDIALGTSRLFGIDLLRNFAFPYFSRDIAEFWRRWHISLSSWFKDYLYIPLGGSKGGAWKKIRNTLIIFIVSGFWHGANWTFIVWGGLNALFIMPSIIFNTNRTNLDIVSKDKWLPSLNEFISILKTFLLTVFAWIFFRATNVQHAFDITGQIFSKSLLSKPSFNGSAKCYSIIIILILFNTVEWLGREKQYAIADLNQHFNKFYRWMFYYLIIITIIYFGGKEQNFIYFQF
jgi:alginate O-acetyltransferase complex protein AlgI